MINPTKDIGSEIKSSSLKQEWDQFNKRIQDTPKTMDVQETTEYHTPLHTQNITESELMDEQATNSQQTKIIPALPTSEFVLKVTKIPP